MRLTARVFLKLAKDKTRLSTRVVLTPVPWIAASLAKNVQPTKWQANGSQCYRDIPFGKKRCDLLLCLPGASMGLITMEEAIAAGTKEFFFVGTASSVEGEKPLGDIDFNGSVVSVLNPYREHEEWKKIRQAQWVDMETAFLRKLAKQRGVIFQDALIASDAIWENRWKQASSRSLAYTKKIKKTMTMVQEWVSR